MNHIRDLRTALETVCPHYYRRFDPDENYTLSTLLQDAVGRSGYNRTIEELKGLSYFDSEDMEEILKAIDLLQNYHLAQYYDLTIKVDGTVIYRGKNHNFNPALMPGEMYHTGGMQYSFLSNGDSCNQQIEDLLGTGVDLRFESTGLNRSEIDIAYPEWQKTDRIDIELSDGTWDEEFTTISWRQSVLAGGGEEGDVVADSDFYLVTSAPLRGIYRIHFHLRADNFQTAAEKYVVIRLGPVQDLIWFWSEGLGTQSYVASDFEVTLRAGQQEA